jgi:23S rRNA (adenine2030-N6)-methyltransferase
MNYRHEFHAGNFADVFKHIVLTRALLHLGVKPAPFRYIETHAGSGIYDLLGPAPGKTAEWRDGIGTLVAAEAPSDVRHLIEPYLRIVAPLFSADAPRYGGSPWIAKSLLRRQDKMMLCELHPATFKALRANFGNDTRAKLFQIDGYAGLKAFLPPVERRGLVVIDPPFEAAEELATAAYALEKAWRKWTTGIYVLWYPVKNAGTVAGFAANLAGEGIKRVLRLELQIDTPAPRAPLARCGLVIVNPPFGLEAEAKILLPWLAGVLGRRRQPGFLIERLTGE